MPSRQGRIGNVRHECGDELLQAAEVEAQEERLHEIGLAGVLAVCLLAVAPRSLGEAAGVREAALEVRAHGPRRVGVPEVIRLPQLGGHAGMGLDVSVDNIDRLRIERVGDQPGVRLEPDVAVAQLLAELEHLACERAARGQVIRPPERHVAAVQRVGERGPVAESSGRLERLPAERLSPLAVRRPVERLRQAPQKANPHRVVAAGATAQRLFEKVHELVVDGRELDPHAAEAGRASVAQSRACQRFRGIALHGEFRGLPERRQRRRGVSCPRLRGSQQDEKHRPRRTVVETGFGERVERARELARRILVSEQLQRLLTRGAREAQDLLRRTPERRQVVREFGQTARALHAALESSRNPAVHRAATVCRLLLVERLLDKRMRESVAAHTTGDLDEHAGGDGLVEQLDQAILPLVQDRREDVDVELAANHRGDAESLERRRRQALQPPGHELHDPRRDAYVLGREPLCRGNEPRGLEMVHELLDEEGIAGRLALQPVQELGRRREPGERSDKPADVVGRQPADLNPFRGAVPLDVGLDLRERMPPGHLAVPVSGEQQQRGRRRDNRQMLQEKQSRLVGPLQVVQDDENGMRGRHIRQQRRDRLEEPVATSLRVLPRQRVSETEPRFQLGHEACQLRRAHRELQTELVRVALEQVVAKRLHERLVRNERLLEGASPEHDASAFVDLERELGGESCLADARLSGD